jgi:WD40 repeat protein
VETGKITAGPFKGHACAVNSVAFSQDGNSIVSGSVDKAIRIWDANTGEITAGPFEGHTDWVWSVAFSPDSKRVVSGSVDKTIRILDVETRKTIAGPFEGHTDSIFAVAFSPDGKRVVSGSRDKTIRIWNVELSSSFVKIHVDVPRFGYHLAIGWAPDENDKLLFWVPQFYRVGLCGDATPVVIGTHAIRPDFSQFAYGENWTKCYSHVSGSLSTYSCRS